MEIIFDIGGVILNWDPDHIIESFFPKSANYSRIQEAIFQHEDWRKLDLGNISRREAIDNMSKRTGMEYTSIKDFLDSTMDYLTVKQDTIDLMRELKVKGNNLYVLSNMQLSTIDYLRKAFSFWDCFSS